MDNKTILITGCSSGIGYATAKELANRDYRVFATARKPADVDRLAREGLESLELDLRSSASIRSAVQEVLARTGGTLYALFNNAAYGQPGAVEDLRTEVLREQFESNFFGWHELTRQIVPVMRHQGYGRIIQNSSVLGMVAMKYRGAYSASKFAIEALTDTLRMELAGTGIYVALIEPGPIESAFRANSYQAFQANIDRSRSPHRETYDAVEKRLTHAGPEPPFTLPAEAVARRVVRILECRRPRARYYVTVPTYVFAVMKRLFPHWLMDVVLIGASAGEHRKNAKFNS